MNLDTQIFVNVVTTILDYFWDIVESTKCTDQPRFDVGITKEGDFFVICVTNYGCSVGHFEDILLSFFNELSPRIEIHSYFETITVIVKGTNGEEWAYDLRYTENRACQICMRRLDAKETRRFAHVKKYQCFKLKSTLSSKDIGKFTESLSENIKALEGLHQSYPNAKCTLHSGKKMIFDNRVESNKTMVNSKLMSSAIMKIIVQSRNDEFRKRCLSLLDVSDSLETGEAVMSKLTSLVPTDNSQQVKKDNKHSTASRNDQARKTVIVKVNQENNRANKRSSATNSDQERTSGKENNQTDNTVATPIFISSRGRRLKRTKFYDELHNP